MFLSCRAADWKTVVVGRGFSVWYVGNSAPFGPDRKGKVFCPLVNPLGDGDL